MNKGYLLAYDILQSMDIAILRRVAPKRYEIFGRLPDFYLDIFSDDSGIPSCEPWLQSPMLEFFLEDVESFFEEKSEGSITSCMWQEEGKTTEKNALIAIAKTYGTEQVLIIRMLQEDFQERAVVLRKARTQLLENRDLITNLEYFKKKSRIDGLTKIFNKMTFMDILQDEIKRSILLNYPLALLILDIDDFKTINDKYGHLVGDNVLENIGILLSKSLRQNDIVARFGGEEFTVLLPQATEEKALKVAQKLRETIAKTKFQSVPGITVSIGCSLYSSTENLENFIHRADIALYDAKINGKNKVCKA